MSTTDLLLGGGAAALVMGALPRPVAPRLAVPHHPPPAPAAQSSRPGPFGLGWPTIAGWLLAALVAGALLPPLAPAVLAAPVVRRHRAARRHRRDEAQATARALPEAVDLLLLCSGAGLSLPLALPLVAERAPGPVGRALRAAEDDVAGGRGRADATLDHLGRLGDPAAQLAHVVVDHLRYGTPLGPGLERTALELRLARRRRAEEAARRLPVRLLAPLLLCVLPAFVLLTVVPLLVAALRSLPR